MYSKDGFSEKRCIVCTAMIIPNDWTMATFHRSIAIFKMLRPEDAGTLLQLDESDRQSFDPDFSGGLGVQIWTRSKNKFVFGILYIVYRLNRMYKSCIWFLMVLLVVISFRPFAWWWAKAEAFCLAVEVVFKGERSFEHTLKPRRCLKKQEFMKAPILECL